MSAAIAHPHRPRFITEPGGTLVCVDCGTPLELVCAKGHNPAGYVIEPDAQNEAAKAPAPSTRERGQSKTPPSDGDL